MNRKWKLVKGKEKWAEISSDGLIHYFGRGIGKYPNERWTWGSENGSGYLNACIGHEHKGVHVWVYLTFVGEIPKGFQVGHLNENRKDNRIENLSLMTPKENCNWGKHNAKLSVAHRGKPKPKVAAALTNGKTSKGIEAVDPITKLVVYTFPSLSEAERQGFHKGCISECCNGEREFHQGLLWRFKNAQEQIS